MWGEAFVEGALRGPGTGPIPEDLDSLRDGLENPHSWASIETVPTFWGSIKRPK